MPLSVQNPAVKGVFESTVMSRSRVVSTAVGGETYIPIPDGDEDQLQRRAGAVAKLEKGLNLLGHLVASMEWVCNATGAVLSLWPCSVVLAQLSLESVDKWFAVVIVFMQAIRCVLFSQI